MKVSMNISSKGLFGTDGIRAKVGHYPLTEDALPKLGRALALWAQEKYGTKAHFLIASDTRYSCSWLKAHLESGLLSTQIKLSDAHILPTPAVFHLINESPTYTGGIIISASHNTAEDNGIKLVDAKTGKLTLEDEKRILELMLAGPTRINYKHLGTSLVCAEAQDRYINTIISLFSPGFLKGHTIVLDCTHGATYQVAPRIFKALGSTCIVINAQPNGYNINERSGALHLESLQEEVIKQRASWGFAFDGDGDRVIAVNTNGEIKDGDDILALLAHHPSYKDLPSLVSTIMANQGLEVYLKALGKELIRTSVGDKYVIEALVQQGSLLGGEPSGHIIVKDVIATGDGILAALKIVQTALLTENLELKSFTRFPQVLINVPIKSQKNLQEPPLSDIIAESKKCLRAGRLIVRYSGTEPLVRIMVEDSDKELTKTVAHDLAVQLQAVLS